MEALQSGIAAKEASRERYASDRCRYTCAMDTNKSNRARMIERAPDSKRAASKTKGKLLGYDSNARSLPTSPGHNGNASPSSTPVLSAAQQAVERARESRVSLVHELAVGAQSMDHLQDKWTGKPEDFNAALEKVAALDPDSKKWNMKKVYWKELDVWKYDYDTSEERELAIQNAIKQFDKQRLSASEPEWQKLLPREERGKGKCLSKLQASLAKGPAQPTPKIKVQRADDSSTSKDDGESVGSEKSRSGGEPMSRSNSGSIFSKAKKPVAAAAAPAKKLPVKKTSPVKGRVAATKANGGRVLSQEIIENSDSSGDEAPLAKSKPRPAPKAAAVVKSHAPASRPQQPAKRPRDDSDSSSSSGTPLSKRLKQRQPLQSSKLKEKPVDKHVEKHVERHVERHVEKNHGSQSTANASSFKSKTTSPTKSSPLASSPPTNASDVEPDYEPVRKKRKADMEAKPVVNKRRVTEPVPGNVMSKANKFKLYYQKYEALHYQISSLDNPPDDKLTSLLNLRERLQSWKKEIYRECSPT